LLDIIIIKIVHLGDVLPDARTVRWLRNVSGTRRLLRAYTERGKVNSIFRSVASRVMRMGSVTVLLSPQGATEGSTCRKIAKPRAKCMAETEWLFLQQSRDLAEERRAPSCGRLFGIRREYSRIANGGYT
jgi:hypothetical protein